MKKPLFGHLLCSMLLLILNFIALHCIAQNAAFHFPPAKTTKDIRPRINTVTGFKVNGKVRLIIMGMDSFYFTEQGFLSRERTESANFSDDIRITDYYFNKCKELSKEITQIYPNRKSLYYNEPRKEEVQLWEWAPSCTYITEKAYFRTKDGVLDKQSIWKYQIAEDSVLMSETYDNGTDEPKTSWFYEYDYTNRIRRKYESPPKLLVEVTYFDDDANMVKEVYYRDGRSYSEKITEWSDSIKKTEKYYHIDSVSGIDLTRTTVFDGKGVAIVDSLHDIGIVQKYFPQPGNPYALQINYDSTGNVVLQFEHQYNQKGQLIYLKEQREGNDIYREEKFDGKGNITFSNYDQKITTFEYLYDAKGNWLKRTTKVAGRKPEIEHRTIYYYP